MYIKNVQGKKLLKKDLPIFNNKLVHLWKSSNELKSAGIKKKN